MERSRLSAYEVCLEELEQSGAITRQFEGAAIVRGDLRRLIEICAECDLYLTVDAVNCGQAEPSVVLYRQGSCWAQLTKDGELASLTGAADGEIEELALARLMECCKAQEAPEAQTHWSLTNELLQHCLKDTDAGRAELLAAGMPEDAAALLAIYAPYVTDTAITFEYDVPGEAEFAERIRRTLERYPYLVAERGGACVGYAYAGAFKERAAYAWGVETSIYVRRTERRTGVGGKLYAALEEILRMQNVLNLNACIAVPAQPDRYLTRDSIAFHERCGYRFVGEFYDCGYKFGRWYNMAWMEKHIGAHTAQAAPVKPFAQVRGEATSRGILRG